MLLNFINFIENGFFVGSFPERIRQNNFKSLAFDEPPGREVRKKTLKKFYKRKKVFRIDKTNVLVEVNYNYDKDVHDEKSTFTKLLLEL